MQENHNIISSHVEFLTEQLFVHFGSVHDGSFTNRNNSASQTPLENQQHDGRNRSQQNRSENIFQITPKALESHCINALISPAKIVYLPQNLNF